MRVVIEKNKVFGYAVFLEGDDEKHIKEYGPEDVGNMVDAVRLAEYLRTHAYDNYGENPAVFNLTDEDWPAAAVPIQLC